LRRDDRPLAFRFITHPIGKHVQPMINPGDKSMRSVQVTCFALTTLVAIALQSAALSYAKNLELQNQNHVMGRCAGAGNCRFGDNSTSRPTPSGTDRSAASTRQSDSRTRE
jgi:hypothetical protein